MSGAPVVIASNGLGVPVKPVSANAPQVKIATNGLGLAAVAAFIERPAPNRC